jgi:hypothetical protein
LATQLAAGLDGLTERAVVSGGATIDFKHAVTSEKSQSGPRTSVVAASHAYFLVATVIPMKTSI